MRRGVGPADGEDAKWGTNKSPTEDDQNRKVRQA